MRAEDLEKPVKKGTICAARFKVDDNWYRAKILSSIGKGDFEVQFLDFGNIEVVNGSTGDLKRLPENLMQYAPLAKKASLAFLKAPKAGSDMGDAAAKIVQDLALDKSTDAIIVDSDSYKGLQVVLFPSNTEKNWNNSINAKLIQKGYAATNVQDDEYPEDISKWFDFEEEARENQIGIWQYGGADAFDEEAD